MNPVKNPKIIVKAGYKKIAMIYHRRRLKGSGSKALLKKLIKTAPKHGRVLDVGCGGGCPVSKFFSDRGYEVIGIDLSDDMIKIAKKTVPIATFLKMDMTKIKFPKNYFDIITVFYSIIHTQRKLHSKIIYNFYKMLNKNGVMLISMGIENEEYTRKWHGVKMYWSHFDKKTNLDLIRKIGFKILWNKDLGPENDRHTWILCKK